MRTRIEIVTPETQSRREFFRLVGQLSVLVAAGTVAASVLESCQFPDQPSGGPDVATIPATEAGGQIHVAVDAESPLAASGTAAMVQTPSRKILVARTDESTFHAFSAVCTHQGCIVSQYQNGTFTCGCHGAQYDTAGQVTHGPATRNLTSYATSFDGTTLTILL